MPERRRSSRFPIDAVARLQPVGGQPVDAHAYSVALGGMSLRSPAPLEPGHWVDLELPLPLDGGANRLRARCRVNRCTALDPGPGHRIGLVFERLDSRAMALLDRYFSGRRRLSEDTGRE